MRISTSVGPYRSSAVLVTAASLFSLLQTQVELIPYSKKTTAELFPKESTKESLLKEQSSDSVPMSPTNPSPSLVKVWAGFTFNMRSKTVKETRIGNLKAEAWQMDIRVFIQAFYWKWLLKCALLSAVWTELWTPHIIFTQLFPPTVKHSGRGFMVCFMAKGCGQSKQWTLCLQKNFFFSVSIRLNIHPSSEPNESLNHSWAKAGPTWTGYRFFCRAAHTHTLTFKFTHEPMKHVFVLWEETGVPGKKTTHADSTQKEPSRELNQDLQANHCATVQPQTMSLTVKSLPCADEVTEQWSKAENLQ